MRVAIEFEWRSLGRVEVDGGGSLRFPSTPTEPGVYRVMLSEQDKSAVSIGEADNLRRRMQHYRTPGPTEPPKLRLNDELREYFPLERTSRLLSQPARGSSW